MRGHIIHTHAIVLRRPAGKVLVADTEYEVGTTPDGSPIITSRRSGNHWRLTWPALVRMALEDGIDDPAPAPAGGPVDAA